MSGLVVDLFAGGGGASAGLEAALGRIVDLAINHDALAMAVHRANHPGTRHLAEDIWQVDPIAATGGAPVDVLWASPDCTHFSVAKGGKPRKKKIRSLAWRVVDWARAVAPRIIFIENVAEFRYWGPLDRQGKPIQAKRGFEFRKWLRALERLGYEVDYRVLDASLYGAPTKRRRVFLVARRDGLPISWPEPTHGPGRLPLHTAAECIDWSIPCPSIFTRKKPLAEKTLWRIAEGIRRFVLDNPEPYIVGLAHGEHRERAGSRSHGLEEPIRTMHAGGNNFALVTPSLVGVGGRAGLSAPTAAGAPVGTVTAKNDRAMVLPTLVEMNHSNAPHGVDEPLGVVTTQHNRFNVVAPSLVKFRYDSDGVAADEPMPTITAGGNNSERPAAAGHALGILAPTLVQTGYGERPGQAPRALDLQAPIGTLVDGQKHGLVAAFLAKHFSDRSGGFVGAQALDEPTPTVTTRDHNAPVAATLVKLRGACNGAGIDEPAPTITGQGNHVAEVRAFLTAFYGTDGTPGKGQHLDRPTRTITARHRLGLVTISGIDYQIVDIGMRMLEPHELLRAQFGRFAANYDLSAAKTKASKVRLIGNSVCPEIAEALVAANLPKAATEAA
ncbi:MAG: DNA cytosine methyltransferase [Bauldia sp.]|nr:DNA cytosine methyltransferase [Bauldia sp.]